MSDAPAFDAEKEAAAEHEQGLWGRLGRLHGNLEAARLGMIAGGVEFVAGGVIGTAVTGLVCTLPGPLGAFVQTATDQGPPPIPEVTGNRWVDMLIDVDPGTRIAGGFVVSARKLLAGDWFEGGHALARPEAEVTMVVFGAVLGGGGSGRAGPVRAGEAGRFADLKASSASQMSRHGWDAHRAELVERSKSS